jgi:hypothetical protein
VNVTMALLLISVWFRKRLHEMADEDQVSEKAFFCSWGNTQICVCWFVNREPIKHMVTKKPIILQEYKCLSYEIRQKVPGDYDYTAKQLFDPCT